MLNILVLIYVHIAFYIIIIIYSENPNAQDKQYEYKEKAKKLQNPYVIIYIHQASKMEHTTQIIKQINNQQLYT